MRVDGKKPNQNLKNDTEIIGKKVIHNIILLDASSSMAYGKYENALVGVQELIIAAKKDDDNFNYLTIMEFSSMDYRAKNFAYHCKKTPALGTPDFKGKGAHGNTPLNEAIGISIEEASYNKDPEEKVLLTIFTDGAENDSALPYKNPEYIAAMIKKAEENGFTITFVGTVQDTKYAVQNYAMRASNTKSYDGTGAGLRAAMASTVTSREAYSKKVAKGEDVKDNFYSKSIETNKQ